MYKFDRKGGRRDKNRSRQTLEMILKIIKLYVCFEKLEDKLHMKT